VPAGLHDLHYRLERPVKIVPEMTYNVSSGTLSLYSTDSNSRSNILSLTAGCKEYRLFVVHNSQESVTMLSKSP